MAGTAKQILDAEWIARAVPKLTLEILENNKGTSGLAVVGIKIRGDVLAQRIVNEIQRLESVKVPLGALDITLYRDDLASTLHFPEVKGTELPFDVTGSRIVLVDDVLFTGRTVRAALDELCDFGRPTWIQLAVLVDRNHRELPIRADYVGKTIFTTADEMVKVHVKEIDNVDEVLLIS